MKILQKIKKLIFNVATMGVLSLLAAVPAYASTWNTGDVFVGVESGTYKVYDNTGVFKESINDGSVGLNFTTGCAFNGALDKLYTTNFSQSKVEVYDNAHPHTLSQTIDTTLNGGSSAESVVFASSGDFYVGHAGPNKQIQRYNAAGTFQQSYAAAIESTGTDWLELAKDQKTMFYTSEGKFVKRFDVTGAGSQLTDFNTVALPGTKAFALRLLPPFDGSGGLLVADTESIKRLDATGAVIQTYDVAGEDSWFSLNLDPNGTSFWAGNYDSSNFYRFNIATGVVEVGPINTGTSSNTVFGICVKGELTAALQQITLDPETATNEVGEDHTVTAKVTSGGNPSPGVVVTFTVTSGPDTGTTGTGTTDASGKATFTYTNNGTAGTDVITACFKDSSGNQNCAKATKDWVVPTITLTPPTAQNIVGSSHTVTALITLNGNPEPNVLVNFTVFGVNAGASGTCSPTTCMTDATGQVAFTYASNGVAGTDTIVACKAKAGTRFCAKATKDWVSLPGRMTGGGTIGSTDTKHGFELHCTISDLPNNLEVNWGKGNKFHLDTLTAAGCSDDPSITPNPPSAGFDTYVGKGNGRYNGVSGYTAKWKFTDAGEPGVNDYATITVYDPANNPVATFSGNLSKGNQQAHNL